MLRSRSYEHCGVNWLSLFVCDTLNVSVSMLVISKTKTLIVFLAFF